MLIFFIRKLINLCNLSNINLKLTQYINCSSSVGYIVMATPALKAKDLGNKAYKAKQFDVAIQHYNEAIALDPTDITFYNNKGGGFLTLTF